RLLSQGTEGADAHPPGFRARLRKIGCDRHPDVAHARLPLRREGRRSAGDVPFGHLHRHPQPGRSARHVDSVRADARSPAGRDADHRPPATPERLAADERATLRGERDLVLEVRVRAGDTYAAIGQRYLIDLRELDAVRARNGDRLPSEGSFLAIPYPSLNDRFKIRVI